MRYFRRNIIMTKTPLRTAYQYRDVFILQPIVREDIPKCPYARHYPVFLDFYIDAVEGKSEIELTALSLDRVKEICTILTALSNFEFFTYSTTDCAWGLVAPPCSFDEMTLEEAVLWNKQAGNSVWMIPSYTYVEFEHDRLISSIILESPNKRMICDNNPRYFNDEPEEYGKSGIVLPENITTALDTYYGLDPVSRKSVLAAMTLISNGINLGVQYQSIGFISYISAIETLVNLEYKNVKVQHCKECGQPQYKVKKKFLDLLAKYVSSTKNSQSKFKKMYDLRSKIAHTGELFISDVEFTLLKRDEMDGEWFKYLEVQQLARLCVFRWLLINKFDLVDLKGNVDMNI